MNNQKVLIQALESELASIRAEKAKLSAELNRLTEREAVIRKAHGTYTGVPAEIRPTREMNTVDMARTVIRNAGGSSEIERAA